MTPPRIEVEPEEMLILDSDYSPTEEPQPMEAESVEAGNADDTPTVNDPPAARFTWTIDNFSSTVTNNKLYSNVFGSGGYKWRLLIFRRGPNRSGYLSLFLDVADSWELPSGWTRCTKFNLAVVDQNDIKFTYRKDEEHVFDSRASDWGFLTFMPLKVLYDPDGGYLVNDTCVIEADVEVRNYVPYNSKKETGYVGLKNQGATCYLTSLLQTLYNIPYFRKAVYHMPTTEALTIPLALQSIFYKLQYGGTSVSTKELTASFGWGAQESFVQHDVQELNRTLCEKLEEIMKGTVVDGTIQRLFEGHLMNYIECIDVDYNSTRKESYYDLQLDVKGCRDVYASFDKYVEVERLEGDNKYHAEQHGLQDARKGVLFTDFPPVLELHLKRFEYDYAQDTMVKINDRYEFPLQLDLDREDGKYLSPQADRSVRNLYTLHSVLVHRGGVHGGHYYAYIRPTLSDQWLKFDDERITKEDMNSAMDEQYGGEDELPHEKSLLNNSPLKFKKYSNAYMLVYIRESDKKNMMCNVDENDIAEHLRIRLKKEQEELERKKKEREEAHFYRTIKVARDEDIKEQIGKEIYFDLVDIDKVRSFRIHVQTSLSAFKEDLAKEFGIPVHCQRFWLWSKPQYQAYRPTQLLTPNEETLSVGHLMHSLNSLELRLFMEVVELGQVIHPISPPEETNGEIQLFFKLYDPFMEELRYAGRLCVKDTGKPIDILERLKEMAGFAPDEEIKLYEERRFQSSVHCFDVDETQTFSKFQDGDIIWFQKQLKVEDTETCNCPDVESFVKHVQNRQVVRFRSLGKPKQDEFSLELLKTYKYDDVVARLARHLNSDDPSKIRLTKSWDSEKPSTEPIKYREVGHLSDMLCLYSRTSDILYYEVLDIPLPELEGMKTLDVTFHDAKKNEVVIHTLRLPKASTVRDVINDLKTKIELSSKDAEFRLFEIFCNKIYRIPSLDEEIANIKNCYTLRVEEVPEEEKDLGPQDCLIRVNHFNNDSPCSNQARIFGEPFLLLIHEDEMLAEVKVRIQKKLQVSDEEFSKWKFSYVSWGRPTPLQDSDIVLSYFQKKDPPYRAWEHCLQCLQVEHSDNSPKRPCTNQNRRTCETSVKIYN